MPAESLILFVHRLFAILPSILFRILFYYILLYVVCISF